MQHHHADGPDRSHARDEDPVGRAGQRVGRREREVVSDRVDGFRAAQRVDVIGQLQASGGLAARRINLQENRPHSGVVHRVLKVAPDLRVGAATTQRRNPGFRFRQHTLDRNDRDAVDHLVAAVVGLLHVRRGERFRGLHAGHRHDPQPWPQRLDDHVQLGRVNHERRVHKPRCNTSQIPHGFTSTSPLLASCWISASVNPALRPVRTFRPSLS